MDMLILFRPLGEDGPDAYIRCVHLHDELMRGLGKDEHRGRGEQALQGREGVLGLRGPGEGTEDICQGGEGGRDPAESSDKPTVKIGESEEAPDLGAISGSWPLLYRPYLPGVGPDLPLLQNVTQELHGDCVEQALLRLDEEPVLQQSLKDQTNMFGMLLGGPGKDAYIV